MNRMVRLIMLLALLVLLVGPILAAGQGSTHGADGELIRPEPEPVVNRTAGMPDWTARNVEALREEIAERLGGWPSSDPELVWALGNLLGQALVRGIDVSDLIDLLDERTVTPELAESVFDYIHYFENWKAVRTGAMGPVTASPQVSEFIDWHGGDATEILSLDATGGSRATPSMEYTQTNYTQGMTNLTGATVIYDGSMGTYQDESTDVFIGFDFKFYQGDDSTHWTDVRISTNGYLTFYEAGGGALDGTDWSNEAITSLVNPDGFIAPWWDDLQVELQGTTDTISYLTEGTSPNRVFTAEWYSVTRYGGDTGDFHYFQVKLYELTNEIELHYGIWTADASDSATIGMEDYDGADGDCGPNCNATNATQPANNYRFVPPAGDVLVIRTSDVDASVHQILADLGVTYDTIDIEDWTGIDFSPYDQVILAMDGGNVSDASVEAIRTEVIDQGKCAMLLGASAHPTFQTSVNTHWLEITGLPWNTCSSSPHLDLVDFGTPLSDGLPDPYDYSTVLATFYSMLVTDPLARVAGVNCNGHPVLYSKGFIGTDGQLIAYQSSPTGIYWTDPADYALLSQIIENGLELCQDRGIRKSCSVLLLASDHMVNMEAAAEALVETGQFDYGDIDIIDASASMPSVSTMNLYGAVLAWTNIAPSDPVAFGDYLQGYVDQGGGLVMGTYCFNMTWGISGGIFDPGYSPFLPAADATASGSLDEASVSLPAHPFFESVDLGNVSYWYNAHYVNPGLNTGGLVLAQDTFGNNLIALNPSGKVAAVELSPGALNYPAATLDTKRMLANMLLHVGDCDEEILLLSNSCGGSAEHFPTALSNLGLSYLQVDEYSEFTGRIGSGQEWSLVIVDENDFPISPYGQRDLLDYIADGGRCIMGYYGMDADLSLPFEAVHVGSFTSPLDIYRWQPAHPLLNIPNQVPDLTGPVDACTFDGSYYDPTGTGVPVCGYSVSPSPGNTSVIVGNGGRTVLLGGLIGLFHDDNDMDSKVDAVELAENAIVLVLPDPPVVPAAGLLGMALLALVLGGLLVRRKRDS